MNYEYFINNLCTFWEVVTVNKKNNEASNVANNMPVYPARDILYDFNQAYLRNSNTVHVFDNGIKMTTVEAHTLKHICQNPGLTLTDIVNYWGRTKGTVSSQITKLEEKGYVFRKKCEKNSKKVHIYPTELGQEVNLRHARYDIKEAKEFIENWMKKYTLEELYKMNEYMEFYIKTAFDNQK